jgi:indole-3-glycerol phosphate synthase
VTGQVGVTILDRIIERTRQDLARRRETQPLAELERVVSSLASTVPLAPALRGERVRLIAEVKRASPSKGPIAPGISATTVASDYLAGGAAAISVLTDEPFFHGSLDDLEAVSQLAHAARPPRPVLRKDFIIDPYQIVEARARGADAFLLIVATLSMQALRDLLTTGHDYGLEAIVEVHDEEELDRALEAGAQVIGINNRDLRTFAVDLAVTERLAPLIPPGRVIVAESGIYGRQDVERLAIAGVHAVLVGESLMTAPDRRAAVEALCR